MGLLIPGFAFDLLTALVVIACAWSGVRRGFILSAFDVVVLSLVLLIGSRLIVNRPTLAFELGGMSPIAIAWLGFLAIAVFGERIRAVGGRALQWRLRRVFIDRPGADYVNHLAGIGPGGVRGAIYVLLVGCFVVGFTTLGALPRSVGATLGLDIVARAVSESSVANLVSALADEPVATVSSLSPVGTVSPPRQLVELRPATTSSEQGPDELQMLDMVNLVRQQEGLQPLVADPGLGEVALRHSDEMLRLAYFSHVSPAVGSPSERVKRAGIDFRQLGENLAYAPSIVSAFNGLFASPPHRQNLLSTEFRRIGIGVTRDSSSWIMVTQDFTD